MKNKIVLALIAAGIAAATATTAAAATDPTAVWVSGEFADAASDHGGYAIATNASNTIDYYGRIVIGDAATIGATIALPSGTYSKASVLVKYELPSGGAPVANAVIVGSLDTSTHAVGAICTAKDGVALAGYWRNGSNGALTTSGYPFANSPAVPYSGGEGYLLYSYDSGSGTKIYLGNAITNLSGGVSDGLKFGGYKVETISIGGPHIASTKPWAGMKIKGVALFAGAFLEPNDVKSYAFPDVTKAPPEDTERYAVEPVAVWYKDFRTTAKGSYALSVSGTTAVADDAYGSSLTIGDAAAVIDTAAAASGNLTVLIKYSAAPTVTSAPVVAFGGTANNGTGLDVGLYTKSDKNLAVYRNFSTDNSKPYSISGDPAKLSATGGYLLCARKRDGASAYVGSSLAVMAGGEKTGDPITFTYNITSVGVGGNSTKPANANDMVPFTGFAIEKIVVFNGYYTPAELVYVEGNPEDGKVLTIAPNATWNFAAGETRTYLNIGTIAASGTIAITNAATLAEGTYTLATWTTPQQYTTTGAGYGKVGTLVTDGLASGLSARLVYGARAIYLRVDDTAKQAARKPLVVWCYGDSITEGYNQQATGANYRILLYQKLEMLGYKVQSAGVYGLSNGYNSVDPSGTPLTDQYKWHSAKHGATAGPTSLSHRSNLMENVDTLAIQVGTPDVALLLIGVNDLPQFNTVTPVFEAWTNVVDRLVRNLPNTKIVVSTILYSDGTRTDNLDEKITAFNNLVRPLMANMPDAWQGHVLLADLNDCVKSGDPGIIYSDKLHPDWWGYDQMADGYLAKIRECYPDPDADDFPSLAPIPAAPTEAQLGAANKTELAAYRNGFTRLCDIRVEKGQDVNNVVYTNMNAAAASNDIAKVGYFVEFVRDDNHAHKWVWVDMDAFGDRDLASVGLPKRNYQQPVTNLHVCSNHGAIDTVAADDDSVTGWIEFSPYDYGRTASNASAPENYGEPYDWNDTLSESGSYSCMQVFRVKSPSTKEPPGRPQVLFAFNNFQSANSSPADFGIGNFAQHFNCDNGYHVEDWTFVGKTLAKMAPDQYSVKTIEIWTKPAAKETATTGFPVPYSWIEACFPGVEGQGEAAYESAAKSVGANGYAYWESYVLGLEPTNATSKFTATIRMEGSVPVVEYSPTNETLKASGAIEYILQGKTSLTNDWVDCPSFDEPGDTNRFFRVKVIWEEETMP